MIDLGRETDGNNEICLGVRFALYICSAIYQLASMCTVQIFSVVLFQYFRWSMVLPKLKRHLNAKNTLSDHDSIHGHRNLNDTERSAIARHQSFNALKICKITVVSGLTLRLGVHNF